MTQETHKPAATGKHSKFTATFAVLALLIAILAGVFTALIWQNLTALHQDILQPLKQHSQAQQQQLQQQQQTIATLTQTLTKIQQSTDSTHTAQTTRAAAHLIRSANLYLTVGHNPTTALELLNIAQQRLSTVMDTSLFATKKILSRDIQTLKSAPIPNPTDLILKLDAIGQAVKNIPPLPVFKAHIAPLLMPTHEKQTPKKWAQQLLSNLHSLKQLVIIRHIDTPTPQLLAPKQQLFITDQIQMKLSLAEWAVLHQNSALYQHSLTVVAASLQQHFLDKTAIKDILQQLKTLQAINVQPKMPALTASLTAIVKRLSSIHVPVTIKPNTPVSNTPAKATPKQSQSLPKINQSVEINFLHRHNGKTLPHSPLARQATAPVMAYNHDRLISHCCLEA